MKERINVKHVIGQAPVRQGDVAIMCIAAFPEGLQSVEPEKEGFIVAHSETGHHHVLAPHKVQMFMMRDDPMTAYFESTEGTTLDHHRDHHIHGGYSFEPGKYKVIRQQQHTASGWARVQD